MPTGSAGRAYDTGTGAELEGGRSDLQVGYWGSVAPAARNHTAGHQGEILWNSTNDALWLCSPPATAPVSEPTADGWPR